MAGLVPAIDVMTPYCRYVFLVIPGAHATCCGRVPRHGHRRVDVLSRPPLRLRRGRTKSKTVERYLLAKLPDWQSVLRPAGPFSSKAMLNVLAG